MAKVKITVVKKMANPDLVEQYGKGVVLPCDRFEEGQEFLLDKPAKPENFCSWAWADIHRDITILMFDGNLPWINQPGTGIACCTDGLRPVVFKLERVA